MNLAAKKCVPCEGGTPPLSAGEIEKLAPHIDPAWGVLDRMQLRREFRFPDFRQAMAFVNRIAEIAEAEGHHPDIHVTYNRVTLELSTHAIGGLSENDFILAAKIDHVT